MDMNYCKYKKYILDNFEGKRVEEKVLRNAFEIEYVEYYKLIKNLIDDEVIRPISRSGPNGLNPTLHKRYQVSKIANNLEDFSDEIKRLHPIFYIEGYLANPLKYSAERSVVLTIDKFLRVNSSLLDEPASINERSFQIFGKEKFIRLDPSCKAVFNFNTRLEEYLNMYHTPEPFFEHTIETDIDVTQLNVLIIENKDTWYTLRKLMNKGFSRLYGISFNALIFGEGKKITRKRDSLTEFAMTYYDQRIPMNFYYFGDLDMEGIEIFENVIKVNADLNINLLKQAYLDMLDEAMNRTMPNCSELQQPSKGKVFFSYFDLEQVEVIKELLNEGKYIPQEILPYGFFKEKIEKRN